MTGPIAHVVDKGSPADLCLMTKRAGVRKARGGLSQSAGCQGPVTTTGHAQYYINIQCSLGTIIKRYHTHRRPSSHINPKLPKKIPHPSLVFYNSFCDTNLDGWRMTHACPLRRARHRRGAG
jgi:hypothetical protein